MNERIPDTTRRLATAVMLVSLLAAPLAAIAQTNTGAVSLEWLTWSFFRMTSPGGKVLLTNPWLSNPDSRVSLADIDRADIILVPTGHRDEVGETVEIASKTGAKVVATWEMAGGAFKGRIPEAQLVRVQPGSSLDIDGIHIRVVGAVHGTGGRDESYGGAALGFFVTFENGYTVYFSGSTDLTLDMQLWGSLFRPRAAILYYSSAMAPADVAQMARLLSAENPGLETVIPHHHRLTPPAGRTPARLGEEMTRLGLAASLLNPEPGRIYNLGP